MKSFNDVIKHEAILQSLADLKFNKPTKIQSAVLPTAMTGRDIVACAETGSGKTAAFAIPMISKLIDDENALGLVLAPTRELAKQITDVMRQLTAHCKSIKVTPLVGGSDIRRQLRSLDTQPRIIVATPGRLLDLVKRRSVNLDAINIIVLDEGDRMIDMGFAPQIDQLFAQLPRKRQTLLFTATLDEEIKKMASRYQHDAKSIRLGKKSLPVASIRQSVIQVEHKKKDERLVDELNKRSGSVIVFAKTKNRTNIIAQYLLEYGFPVRLIHSDRTQGQRNKAIKDFREGRCRVLCATDVAARGIDITQVEHVINFDLPVKTEDYVHRVGRTARNGGIGEAVSFVTPEEHQAWNALVKKFNIPGGELKLLARESGGRTGSKKKSRGKKKTSRVGAKKVGSPKSRSNKKRVAGPKKAKKNQNKRKPRRR